VPMFLVLVNVFKMIHVFHCEWESKQKYDLNGENSF
jgi:hypothetical protein